MGKKKSSRSIKEDGFVFETEGTSAKELDTSHFRALSYDPFEITQKIMQFGKALIGIPLYGYQEAIAFRCIYSVVAFEGAVLTVLLSRQSGKTETMAFVIGTLAVILPSLAKFIPDLEQYKDGFRIGLFAPQSDQVMTTYSRAYTRLTSANAEMILSDPDISTYLESSVNLQLSNGSYLKGQTASKQSKIESKTYDLVIIEEAQEMEDFIVSKSIEPMVSATSGSIIKVGTTGQYKNHFWYEIVNNRNLDRKVLDPRLLNHLEYDYKKIIVDRRKKFEEDGRQFHLNYERDIVRKKQRWGEESQAFKLSYALIWDLESGMLITDKDWDKITNRKKGFSGVSEDDRIVAGIDIAKSPASTILTIGKVIPNEDDFTGIPKKEIIMWMDLGGLDYEAQHRIILDAIVEYNISCIFADNTGVGRAVVDRLMYACGEYVDIVPYAFTTPSKSDMWYNFISDITTGRLIVPANKTVRGTTEFQNFEEQMKNCQKFFNGSYLVCEKSPGYFDDYVDSCALMCLAGNKEVEVPYEMEVLDNPLYGTKGVLDMIKRNSY